MSPHVIGTSRLRGTSVCPWDVASQIGSQLGWAIWLCGSRALHWRLSSWTIPIRRVAPRVWTTATGCSITAVSWALNTYGDCGRVIRPLATQRQHRAMTQQVGPAKRNRVGRSFLLRAATFNADREEYNLCAFHPTQASCQVWRELSEDAG